MLRGWLLSSAATLLLAVPVHVQRSPAADSAWPAALLPIMRTWVATARVMAVGPASWRCPSVAA
jgi:hypothetical protein